MALTGKERVLVVGVSGTGGLAATAESVSTADIAAVPGAIGTTAQRPASPAIGQGYFDTVIGLPIWWNGSTWINAAGVPV